MEPSKWQLLRGKENARQWKRDFKVAAMAKGVQDVFTGIFKPSPVPNPKDYGLEKDGAPSDDTVKFIMVVDVEDPSSSADKGLGKNVPGQQKRKEKRVIEKPRSELTDDELLAYKKYQKSLARETLNPDQIHAIVNATNAVQEGLEFSGRLAIYKFNLDEYDKSRRIINTAMALLMTWVDPSLRAQMEPFDDPKDAYDFMLDRYTVSDARAHEMATNNFEKLYVAQFNSVQQYVNAIENAREDILDAGGICNDTMVINKIIRGLSGPFKPFVTQYHMLQEMVGMSFGIDAVITQLLTFESNMPKSYDSGSSRGYRGPSGRYSEPKQWNTQQMPNDQRARERCAGCGTWGHKESDCWKAHPDKRPQSAQQGQRANRPAGNGGYPNRFPKPSGMSAMATIDYDSFADALNKAKTTVGPNPECTYPETPSPALANSSSQVLPEETGGDRQAKIVEGRTFKGEAVQEFLFGHRLCNASVLVPHAPLETVQHRPSQSNQFKLPFSQHHEPYRTDVREQTAAELETLLAVRKLTPADDTPLPLLKQVCKLAQDGVTLKERFTARGLNQAVTPPIHDKNHRTCDQDLITRLTKATRPDVHTEYTFEWEATDPSGKHCFATLEDPVQPNAWILDSGANVYICNDATWFADLRYFDTSINTAGQGGAMRIVGGGTVKLVLQDGDGDDFTLTLNDVAFAPNSRCNLISVSKLAAAGLRGSWAENGMLLLTEDNFEVGMATLTNGLYHLSIKQAACPATTTAAAPFVASVDFDDPVWKEHRRLGHLSLDRMIRLVDQSTGIKVSKQQIKAKLLETCPICVTSRAVLRIPREPGRRRATKPGQRLHADIWGPYPIIANDLTRYILFVTDDDSRMTDALRLQTKDEMPNVLRTYIKEFQRPEGINVETVHVDNEFNRGAFKDWTRKHGIKLEPIAPHAHHQLGVAERVNRTIREGAAAMVQDDNPSAIIRTIVTENGKQMMQNSSLPQELWPEAIQYATWLKSRTPTSSLKWKVTPWEKRHNMAPDLTRELTWGTRMYVNITKEERINHWTKLHHPRAWIGYFVGCENESTYRVWDPTKKVVRRVAYSIARDAEGLDDVQFENPDGLADAQRFSDEDEDYSNESDDHQMAEPSKYFNHPSARFSNTNRNHAAMVSERTDRYNTRAASKASHLTAESDEEVTIVGDAAPPDSPEWTTTEDSIRKLDFGKWKHSTESSVAPNDLQDNDQDQGNDTIFEDAEEDINDTIYVGSKDRINSENIPAAWGTPIRHAETDDALHDRARSMIQRAERTIERMNRESDRIERRSDKLERNRLLDTAPPASPLTEKSLTRRKQTPSDAIMISDDDDGEGNEDDTNDAFEGEENNHYQEHPQGVPSSGPYSKTMIPQRSAQDSHAPHLPVPFNEASSEEEDLRPTKKRRPGGPKKEKQRRPPPGNRSRKRVPDRDKCMVCFDNNRNCERVPGEQRCRQCSSRKMKCYPLQLNPDGSLPKRKYSNTPTDDEGKFGRTAEQIEAGCTNCRSLGRVCDAELPIHYSKPCSNCAKTGAFCTDADTREAQYSESKCMHCQSTARTFCDRNRPCHQCVIDGTICQRSQLDGAHWIGYPTRPDQSWRDVRGSKCARCYANNGVCDAQPGKPCRLCWANLPNSREERRCTIWAEDGLRHAMDVTRFKRNDEDDTVFDPTTKQYTLPHGQGARYKKPSQWDDYDTSDSEDTTQSERRAGSNLEKHARRRARATLGQYRHDDEANFAVSLAVVRNAPHNALRPDPENYTEAMRSPDAKEWKAAIQQEYHSLLSNGTWEVAELPPGRKALTTKWVLKKKLGPHGQLLKYKARMVARGFQQIEGYDYTETYSGVVKAAAYRLLFSMIVPLGWICHQMDVVTAFLNGEVYEEIYVCPPQGYPQPGKVLRLRKALYGLKQSPRLWYRKLRQWLCDNGWTISKYDECVFYNTDRHLIITVYVDDINIFGPNELAIEPFKRQIGKAFKMTDAGLAQWYLGLQLDWKEGGLHIHQQGFVNQSLNKYGLLGASPSAIPIDPTKKMQKETESAAEPDFKKRFMSMTGTLNYLQSKTYYPLAFPVSLVSRYMTNPNQGHMDAVLQMFRFIATSPTLGLWIPNSKENTDNDHPITGFVDSDWGGCSDTGRSTTGWVFAYNGCPVSWSSQRQKTVSSSSTEAEYIAASDACKEALWLKGFHNEIAPVLGLDPTHTIELNIDNASAIKLTRNPEFHGRTKHINIRHHFIRECVEGGEIEPRWISGTSNPADLFTKALPKARFWEHVDTLNRDGPVTSTLTTISDEDHLD